jgi:peptidoglycan/LPS O-acetylase OafA/YrhL
MWVVFAIALLSTLVVSTLSWRFVEQTSIETGRLLGRRFVEFAARRRARRRLDADGELAISPSHTVNP